jgi:hypothetical protein
MAYHREYARLLCDSQFVLCPRGVAPCSYRLTETMYAGRVPVIIADDWHWPDWIPWDDFAVIVKEQDVLSIPDCLRALEQKGPILGARAQSAWKQFMAPGQARASSIANLIVRLQSAERPKHSSTSAVSGTLCRAARTRAGRAMIKASLKRRFLCS